MICECPNCKPFQKKCCEYIQGNWKLKPAGSLVQVCGDCMNKITRPQPEKCPHCDDRFSTFHKDCCLCGKPKPVDAVEAKIEEIIHFPYVAMPAGRQNLKLEELVRELVKLVREEK